MSTLIKIQDTQTLIELTQAMKRFTSEIRKTLTRIDRQIAVQSDWIKTRVIYWQNEVTKAQNEFESAKIALDQCKMKLSRSKEGNNGFANCSDLQRKYLETKNRFDYCVHELERTKTWQSKFEIVKNTYSHSEGQLRTILSSNTEKAIRMLQLLFTKYEAVLIGARINSGLNQSQLISPEEVERINLADNLEIQKLTAAIRLFQISGIQSETWSSLSPSEKLEVIISSEHCLAELQGRPPNKVIAETMEENINGYFYGDVIYLNEQNVMEQDVENVLKTTIHEGRHAYQRFSVDNPGFHADSHETQLWKENFENYFDAETYGFDFYYFQPLEVDARAYSESIVNMLYR